MKLYKLQYLLVLFIVILAIPVAAEESGESFALPETPPTIERKKIPPLDKPLMQKQDFVSETEIEPPFIWQNRGGAGSGAAGNTAEIELYKGNYSSAGGGLLFRVENGSMLRYDTFNTAGENDRLSLETNEFSYKWERIGSGVFSADIGMNASDTSVWTQKHRDYSAASKLYWHPGKDFGLKLSLNACTAEVLGMQSNNNFGGSLEAGVSPWQGHNVTAWYSSQSDSAFDNIKVFSESGLSYGVLLFDALSVKAGALVQKNESFPLGNIAWNFLPRARLSVGFKSGREKPEWAGLYTGRNYVSTEPALLPRKADSRMEEEVSYFFRDSIYAKVRAEQSSWKDYICWARAAGTDYIAPVNVPGTTEVMETGLELALKRSFAAFKVSYSGSSVKLPFVPEYTFGLDTEFYLPHGFTLGAGYSIISERRVDFAGADKMASFGDMTASIQKDFNRDIIIYAKGKNLSGGKHEIQPGFEGKVPEFQFGVRAGF